MIFPFCMENEITGQEKICVNTYTDEKLWLVGIGDLFLHLTIWLKDTNFNSACLNSFIKIWGRRKI